MEVLERGGNAIDAMVSAAAMIAVAYPHMNGLGGDSFWIVHQPGSEPWAIDASGAAASAASPTGTTNAVCKTFHLVVLPPR